MKTVHWLRRTLNGECFFVSMEEAAKPSRPDGGARLRLVCVALLIVFSPSAVALLVVFSPSAHATMPFLTPMPDDRSPPSCERWAAQQDGDAIYAWGQQDGGGSSKDVAALRLALYCLGDPAPEIIGFGSSAGFDRDYCERHRRAAICAR
ncbi:MAG: hypothetical protein P4L68_04340 [Methylovirgula sp.]|nr:hypothetical protein [Methylovirgula sp.]